MDLTISVERADIIDFPCDVLVLKYAQTFYGADARVADLLRPNQPETLTPQPDKYAFLSSQGMLGAKNVLFVGVVPLHNFSYDQIREFASYSLRILSKEAAHVEHIAMTMHGIGYGLDERESFLAQLAGLVGAERVHQSLKRITIVERDQRRAERLQRILAQNLSSPTASKDPHLLQAGVRSNEKPHIFVAMPYSKEMEDVYIFGIEGPIHAAGFLCERVDMTTFMGDILARIKSRIETASLVVADLTGANANVYLEVGYAWGKDRPTLLLAKVSEELKFDVRGQRCIVYDSIADLKKKLEADLKTLI